MEITEYSDETMEKYLNLRETVAQMRYELRTDPEGAFGGRGNNIGSAMLERHEAELAELDAAGYTRRTAAWAEMCRNGFTFAAIDGIGTIHRNGGKRVAIPRRGRGKMYNGRPIANWAIDDPEIPEDVFREAMALFDAGIEDFRVPVVIEN